MILCDILIFNQHSAHASNWSNADSQTSLWISYAPHCSSSYVFLKTQNYLTVSTQKKKKKKKKKKKVVQTQKYQEASAIFRCTEALQSRISKTQTTSKARKYHAGSTRGTNYKTSYL